MRYRLRTLLKLLALALAPLVVFAACWAAISIAAFVTAIVKLANGTYWDGWH